MQLECYGVEKRQIWENWRTTWVYTATCFRGSFCFAMGVWWVQAPHLVPVSVHLRSKLLIAAYHYWGRVYLPTVCCLPIISSSIAVIVLIFSIRTLEVITLQKEICNALSMMMYVFACFLSPYHALPMRMLIKTTVDMTDPSVDGPWLEKLSGYMILGIRSFLSQ